MLLIQVLLIQVSTIIIFDNLYVQNQSTTTAQALARTKTRMTTWLNSNFRGRWKEVSGPNVTLASNQWMIVMRIGKQGGNYDYHYWYRTNDGPWANKHGQTPSVLLPASDMPTTNSSSGWTLNGKTGFYNSSIVYCQLLSEYVISCACVPLCYGNLSQSEYDHLGTCREELRQSEAKIAALQTMTAAQLPDFDREIAQANASIAEIKRKMANVIAYISKRAELTFSQLKMNRVEISLYDVVKSTGEVKDTFKFQYGGRRYDRLSLSEKIRAGMEVSELMKRLTGRNYPVFVDNMESVDDLANVRPTGQIIMAKCVSGAALQVKPIRPIAFAEQRAA